MRQPFFITLIALSLVFSGCGLMSMIGLGGDEEAPPEEAEGAPPPVAPAIEEGAPVTKREFFQLKKDLSSVRSEMARIKNDIETFKSQPEEVLTGEPGYGFIETQEITHKVTLSNGTEVLGKIIRESLDDIVITTQIGTLTIARRHIKDVSPAESPRAECYIIGELGQIEKRVYSDKRVYSGIIKNRGERRADFVLIKVKLAEESTRIVAVDSSYVDGDTRVFNTGIISDTSIEPDQEAPFTLTVYLPPNAEVAYFTAEVSWKEYD